MKYLSVALLFTVCIVRCNAYKILAIFPMPSRSHNEISSTLVSALANKGHEVTVATPFLVEKPIKNLKEISLESMTGVIQDVFANYTSKLYDLDQQTPLELSQFIIEICLFTTEATLRHENVQNLLHANEKYDVVLLPQYLHEGLLGIAHHFKVPLVLVSTMPLYSSAHFVLAHPSPPSYVPNLLSQFTGRMNFWQRLTNTFYDAYIALYYQWVCLPQHREMVKKYIPGQPDLYDFLNNASVLLLNSHMSSYEAFPYVPNAIEVGGLHIKEPKTLPEDLQKFLDDSVHGVIVFSLGSNLKSSEMPPEQLDAILRTFSKLKQNVLCKWEIDSLPNQPKNVKLMKWLPQSDVLAHPNVKALINHGGLLSSMESIYHGVPFIGIPFFADQKMNMAGAVSYEYAIRIYFPELTEEKLTWALDEILYNPKYRNNIKKRSYIMRDRQMRPLDSAIYWIEYVVRHQGARHLRYPGMDLTWYQRNLLDVIAFIVLTICIIIIFIVIVTKKLFKRISKSIDNIKKKN